MSPPSSAPPVAPLPPPHKQSKSKKKISDANPRARVRRNAFSSMSAQGRADNSDEGIYYRVRQKVQLLHEFGTRIFS